GNRLSTTYPSGLQVANTFDALNRVSEVKVGTDSIAHNFFSGPGLLEKRTYGNGTELDLKSAGYWGYDAAKRVTALKHVVTGSATQIVDLEYGYDRDSERRFERRLHD